MKNVINLRAQETKKSPLRLVCQLVFFVALKGKYSNMLPLTRLEYKLKSCAVFVDLLISMTLNPDSAGKEALFLYPGYHKLYRKILI